jgi:hypothetical protein
MGGQSRAKSNSELGPGNLLDFFVKKYKVIGILEW